jgi:RHH-type proline utilization regulon transcriptional repressor/proline dehydrogenase/delta 1-pyrroline-5-carboxylate dehydrogenase
VKDLAVLLSGIETDPNGVYPAVVQKAVALARLLQTRGNELQTPQEKRQQRELERVMQNPGDKVTLIQMTDQAFRSRKARRAAEQLTHILDVQGVPRFFSTFDRLMLKGFQSFGSYLPGVSVPMVKEKMRAETANVILPAEPELLTKHLEQRRKSGVRMNVNYLGEALLGEDDAERRLAAYLATLQLPEIEVISVKISTIYSQISSLARASAIRVLSDRMELLYRAAAKATFARADGSTVPKFVYLDMEEYRDLSITLEVFMETLDRPGLEKVSAGIALQAYIPDSYAAQREINRWARRRVASGGAPVTIRIVKGANMEMERVEASLAGWPQAPFQEKADTDANYKRMLQRGLEPDNVEAVRIGVASHNLFDLSYALALGHERGVLDRVQFEMLEGMANHQRRALCELTGNMLLYAPATRKDQFLNAVGYLIRRLDENSGPENFLRHAFKLEVGSEEWKALEEGFLRSFERIGRMSEHPRRRQNRRQPLPDVIPSVCTPQTFVNEPDTDFALVNNRVWAEEILARWRSLCGEAAAEIPLVVAGESILEKRTLRECFDPSRPGTVVGRYREGNQQDLQIALDCAVGDSHGWRTLAPDDREGTLAQVAQELRRARGDLIGAALAECGKLIAESDPEVSEAIDFVEYYVATTRTFRGLPGRASPKGVVAVVTPWNFPIAIPCGGIAAALATGNNVILKPAPQAVLTAYVLCECFWSAGVPREALQFLPCSEKTVAPALVQSPAVDVVILTGGTDTALKMLAARPEMSLLAETGGKNATIVTGMSDRELAVKHVVQSAFGHSGQKCSATSLLILEAEVYDDPGFKETLCDAVRSLGVGSAWSLDTRVGPLIQPPAGALENALKELEVGESWAVLPRNIDENPCLYSPAVKWGVSPGSYTHMTEFFGPVLGVLRAENLDDAIELVNQTGFGLTSGLESLDQREHRSWTDAIRAGNLYINRVTTGAIVRRQPFGGVGKSAFGPGIKAGGPNYVAQLMNFDHTSTPRVPPLQAVDLPALESLRLALAGSPDTLAEHDREAILRAIGSYDRALREEFSQEHDQTRLVGQDNIRRYLPVGALRIRVHPDDSAFEIFARVCASKAAGCRTTVSLPRDFHTLTIGLLDQLTESWGAGVEFVEESDDELAEVIRRRHTDRVRYARPDRAPRRILEAVGDTGIFIARSPVSPEGRLELLWYLVEQSISHNYHRYGNLGARADEKRRPVS